MNRKQKLRKKGIKGEVKEEKGDVKHIAETTNLLFRMNKPLKRGPFFTKSPPEDCYHLLS